MDAIVRLLHLYGVMKLHSTIQYQSREPNWLMDVEPWHHILSCMQQKPCRVYGGVQDVTHTRDAMGCVEWTNG